MKTKTPSETLPLNAPAAAEQPTLDDIEDPDPGFLFEVQVAQKTSAGKFRVTTNIIVAEDATEARRVAFDHVPAGTEVEVTVIGAWPLEEGGVVSSHVETVSEKRYKHYQEGYAEIGAYIETLTT